MMDGEPGFRPEKEDPSKAPPAPAPVDPSLPVLQKIEQPQWSEVFADVNWNQQWDEGEKYVDADGDGDFTWCLRSNDLNTNKTRDIGLRERYGLGPWVTVRTIEKQEVQRLQRRTKTTKVGQIVGLPWPPPGGFMPGEAPDGVTAAPQSQPGQAPVTPFPGVAPPGEPQLPGATVPPGQPVPPPSTPTSPGTLPGVPKQPGQPAALAPVAAPQAPGGPQQPGQPQPPGVPGGVPADQPAPTPIQPGPPPAAPVEVPGRANKAPKPAPGPANPFKTAPKK